MIAVGFPSAYKNRTYLEGCTVQRIFVQSTHDEFGPLEVWEPMVRALPEPKQIRLIEAKDHFFAGALEELEDVIAGL